MLKILLEFGLKFLGAMIGFMLLGLTTIRVLDLHFRKHNNREKE